MSRALAIALLLAAPLRAEVRYESFRSSSLGREVAYALDLPPGYPAAGRRYPVLYALHGLYESHRFWERRGLAVLLSELRAQREVPDFLVVAVDGGNSFFVNGREGLYEDLVSRDLLAHLQASHPVLAERQGRALLGISMGGYAALRIAFKQPERFVAVAAHSAMLLLETPTREAGARSGQMEALHRAFGDPIDPALWTASDPLSLASRLEPRTAPALLFDCGAQDRFGLFAGNQALHLRLEARGVAHEFALPPGDHGYEYVRSVLPRSLRFLGAALAQPAAARRTSSAARTPEAMAPSSGRPASSPARSSAPARCRGAP